MDRSRLRSNSRRPICAGFKRRPASFPAEELRKKITSDLTLQVHGIRDMPVWGMVLSRADINDLLKYLETIQRPFEAQPAE